MERRSSKKFSRILCVTVFLLAAAMPLLSSHASAQPIPTIYYGPNYYFTDSTAGYADPNQCPGGVCASAAYDTSTNWARTLVNWPGITLPVEMHAWVGKTVQIAQAGTYRFTFWGHDAAVVSACVADASVWFYLRVVDLSTFTVVGNLFIDGYNTGICLASGGSYNFNAVPLDVNIPVTSVNHQFNVQVESISYGDGLGGTAIADAWNTANHRGIYYNQIEISPAPTVEPDMSSEASGSISVGQTLSWTHTPWGGLGTPNLVTVSCAAHSTGITFAVTYGGSTMSTAVTNQQSNMFTGAYYLSNPPTGAQTVAVKLTAGSGTPQVQCSATTWVNSNGVDLTIKNTNQAMSGSATSLVLGPTASVPANEVFFGAIHRYIPEGNPGLSVYGTGLTATAGIVDSWTNEGTGSNYGCESQNNGWEDCIGTAELYPGGSSMTSTWGPGGYAIGAGFGIRGITRITVDASSDYAGTLAVGQSMSWTHTPAGSPTLVTVSCASDNTGVGLSVNYGGTTMSTGVSYQYSSLFVGLYYLNNPPLGTQPVNVKLTAASATVQVECSASTWVGTIGVDTGIANTNYEWGNSQTYLSIAPARAVPSNEVFFSALSRFEWGAGTTLSVTGSAASAFIVDSNTNTGSGFGHGCQVVPNHPDVDCIALGRLLSPGTSMTYTWDLYGAFAVAAGIGIKTG